MSHPPASLVTVSIGSNINREYYIREAVSALRERFGELKVSPVYETAAVGFDGEDFLNLVVSFETEIDVYQVSALLKGIEDKLGRDRSQPKFSARSIDLDLLTYADLILNESGIQIPRDEILENAFVLKPLSDLEADTDHPQLGINYQTLWDKMRAGAGRIEKFKMDLS